MKIVPPLCVFLILFAAICFSGNLTAQNQPIEARIDSIKYYFPIDLDKADSLTASLLTQLGNRDFPDEVFLAHVRFIMGVIQLKQNRLVLAENYFNEALETQFIKNNDHSIREFSYNNLGIIYDKENKLNLALESYLKSASIYEERMDSSKMMQTWINISLIENKMQNTSRAIEIAENALAYFKRQADTLSTAYAQLNLSSFLNEIGDFEMAARQAEQALILFKDQKDTRSQTKALIDLFYLYNELNESEKAQKHFYNALDLAQKNNYPDLMVSIYLAAGINEKDNVGNYSQAEKYLNQAEQLVLDHSELRYLDDIYEAQIDLFARVGNYKAHQEKMDALREFQKADQKKLTASYHEQLKILFEIDKLQSKQVALENKISKKNRLLWFAFILIVVLVSGAAIFTYLKSKNVSYAKALFRLNTSEIKLKSTSFPSSTSSAEPVFPNNEDVESIPDFSPSHDYDSVLENLITQKFFLDPNLTLESLAEQLGTNTKYLSAAIKNYSGNNFYGFLRELRVKEAINMLIGNPFKANIQTVLYNSGYSNRHTFYRHFKDTTGLSPTEFLELAKKEKRTSI